LARRILLFVTDLEIGGTPTVVRELAWRLNDPGRVEVEVACLGRWGPVADEIRDEGIEVTAMGMRSPIQFIAAVRKLRRIVDERAIDTLQSFLIHANTVAAAAIGKLPNVRLFQSVQTTQAWPRWHWWVQRMIRNRAEAIVVPSSAVARAARERSDVDESRICVIPNAIDPAEFEVQDVFSSDVLRVGFIGRLDPVKRIDALIGAMALVRGINSRCDIFGEGVERAKAQAMIEQFGLRGRVFLRGAVAHPQEALAQMDVLVLPSVGEGFGLVLIEAMASGVPVIAAGRGGILDVVEHEQNGLLIDGDLEKQIASSVLRLARDADLRQRLIAGGLRTVREKFDWRIVIPQYRRLYGVE